MDLQIAFRETGESLHGHAVVAAVGLLCARKGTFDDEAVTHFAVRGDAAGIREIALTGLVSELEMSMEERMSCDLGNLLTSRSWRLPVNGGSLSLFLRKCRVDAAEPQDEVFAFSGMLLTDAVLPADTDAIKAYCGPGNAYARPDRDFRPEGGLVRTLAGFGLGQALEMPLWGFGSERVGLPSTLNLLVADELDTRRALGVLSERTPDEEAGYLAAGAQLQPLGLLHAESDESFMGCVRYLRENYPQMFADNPSSRPLTAREMEDRGNAMKEALQHVMPEYSSRFR